jgi:hypothetical protein
MVFRVRPLSLTPLQTSAGAQVIESSHIPSDQCHRNSAAKKNYTARVSLYTFYIFYLYLTFKQAVFRPKFQHCQVLTYP